MQNHHLDAPYPTIKRRKVEASRSRRAGVQTSKVESLDAEESTSGKRCAITGCARFHRIFTTLICNGEDTLWFSSVEGGS